MHSNPALARFNIKELPEQKFESSKNMNFFLTYKCEKGEILDPIITRIIEEIEDSEWELPPSDNGRYPRKKRRAADPHRRFKQAVRIIILNLLQVSEIRTKNVYLAVSKDANTYILKRRYSPPDMTYDPFIEAYEGLERLRYINIKHKGFYDPYEGGGWCTRISASDLLLSLYEDAKDGERVSFFTRKITDKDKDELIVLKGRKSEKDKIVTKLPYTDNKFTTKARANLKKINRVLTKHEIKLECTEDTYKNLLKDLKRKASDDPEQVTYIDESSVRLYRIFSEGSFKRGGRFYRGWWQQLPEKYRSFITIDGNRTVELDYSRYHISMAYAQLGLTPPEDPYKIHPKVKVDITKYAINAMLNAKAIVNEHRDFDPKKCGITWERFIKLIEREISPIVDNDMWMTGYGLTLQFVDSLIAEEILLHFANQDIPCLPIHDSFIVPEQHKDELRETMASVYEKHMGTSIGIK